jgi:hypothetical protein
MAAPAAIINPKQGRVIFISFSRVEAFVTMSRPLTFEGERPLRIEELEVLHIPGTMAGAGHGRRILHRRDRAAAARRHACRQRAGSRIFLRNLLGVSGAPCPGVEVSLEQRRFLGLAQLSFSTSSPPIAKALPGNS